MVQKRKRPEIEVIDANSISTDSSSSDEPSARLKRIKFRAQRKFAINTVNDVSRSQVHTMTKSKQLSSTGEQVTTATNNDPIDIYPNLDIKTNDFLSFLCLRGTKYLPDRINFDNPELCTIATNKSREVVSEKQTSKMKPQLEIAAVIEKPEKSKAIIEFAVRKSGDPIKKLDRNKKNAVPSSSKIVKKSKKNLKSKNNMRLRSSTDKHLPAAAAATYFSEKSSSTSSLPSLLTPAVMVTGSKTQNKTANKKISLTSTLPCKENGLQSRPSCSNEIEPKDESDNMMMMASRSSESLTPTVVSNPRFLRSDKVTKKCSPTKLVTDMKMKVLHDDKDFNDSDEEPLASKIHKSHSSNITKLSIKAKCQHDKVNDKKKKEHIEKWLKDIPVPPLVKKGEESQSPPVLHRHSVRVTENGNNSSTNVPISTLPPDSKLPFTKKIIEAPVFEPTETEFQNPIEYIEKIRKSAEKYGICRIIPPASFKPECKVNDDMRFYAYKHYVCKMMNRWGPNTKLFAAIKECLSKVGVAYSEPPILASMEVDLPRLYNSVQSLGGLRNVIVKQKWPKVVELMKLPKSVTDACTKLDDLYCKFLLPYETLSLRGKNRILRDVENEWTKKSEFRQQLAEKRIHVNVDSDEEDDNEDDDEFKKNVEDDTLECIIKGNKMPLKTFFRIARNTMSMWYDKETPTTSQVEQDFWKYVNERNIHICVYSGSIDSGGYGYGFMCDDNSPMAKHPWNLKVLTNNEHSILKSMGPIMGLTVPTLHVGMVYTACCWYRDPHGLPWVEYLHTGADKIWYGIPDSYNDRFHRALLKLVPSYCRNKSIWLPSDTAMVPPDLLLDEKVAVCRTVQKPGEFIVVFPKAFTSNICTGYVVSESVYFATSNWLLNSQKIFDDIVNSYEPSMFSLSRLLLSLLKDQKSPVSLQKMILDDVQKLRDREHRLRNTLKTLGVHKTIPISEVKRKKVSVDMIDEYECHFCRRNLFISMVSGSQEEFIYCLTHAIQYIQKNKLEPKLCRIQYKYTIEEIDELINRTKSARKATR